MPGFADVFGEEPNLYKENYYLRKTVEALTTRLSKLEFDGNEKVELTNRVYDAELNYRVANNERITLNHRIGVLSQAIAESAHKAGIIENADIHLTGPQLLLLVADMAECILSLTKGPRNKREIDNEDQDLDCHHRWG